MLFALIPLLGCGDEVAPPSTPPIAEWCDVDRPREDCDAGGIYINGGNLDEARALCETPCTHAKGLSIGGGDAELFKALKGFKTAGSLNIFDSHESVKDLKAFHEIIQASSVRISDNSGLQSLEGLENLTRVAPPEDSGFERSGDNTLEIADNPKLKSVSTLAGLKIVGNIQIFNNSALETIDGINALTLGGVRVESNSALKKISGFEGLETQGSITIIANGSLTTIDGFQNLTQADYIQVLRNRSLDECQVQRIVDQLVEPPQTLDLSANRKACN